MTQPSSIPGAWAVVTGASRGIGRATALALHRRGLHVALVGRSRDALAAVASDCTGEGREARVFDCDLRDLARVERVGAELAELGPAFLFNVAGIIQREAVINLTAEHLSAQFHVNLLAPMLLARSLVPAILSHSRGAVINVGSISGTLGTANQAAYNASKWGLTGFTKCLAEELTDTAALCVCVLPGAVDTDMLRGSIYPARMTADAVAATLIHYALDASSAHNGAIVEMFGT
jgi:3-oxoacyl-[acyl-carrier protein] reductase